MRDVAGGIDENVDGASFAAESVNVVADAHVEFAACGALDLSEFADVNIGRPHFRAFRDKAFGGRAPDALTRRRDDSGPAFELRTQLRFSDLESVNRRVHDLFFGRARSIEFLDDPPLTTHQNAIRDVEDLGQIG